jgi:hypothetical protein
MVSSQMDRLIKNTILAGICLLQCFFNAVANEPFFTKEESLYSFQTGNHIADLSFSISQSDDNADEYILSIRDTKPAKTRAFWIFSQKQSAEIIKKSDSSVEIKNITDFSPFCENREIYFRFSRWHKIKNSTRLPFTTTVSEGDVINLKLCFYISSQNKNKSIIADEGFIKFEFTIPTQDAENNSKENESSVTTLEVDSRMGPTPEELEAKAKQKEDSLIQVRVAGSDLFISQKIKEITAIKDLLHSDGIEKEKIDSLERLADKLNEKVAIRRSGDTDILRDENLGNKFVDFNDEYSEVTKKIAALRIPPPEKDWTMQIGLAIGILMLGGMLFMQIWNPIKLKRQQQKQEEQRRQSDLDSIDINDLDEI